MEFTVTISKTYGSGSGFEYLITDSDIVRMENAMAIPIADICYNNFGYDGQDRPREWPPLSKGYATEYHDGDTTPTLQLSGDLQSSISIDPSSGEGSRVFTDNPYASSQQWGISDRLSARPFFPLNGDANSCELTDFAVTEATTAAEAELQRIISGK